YAFSSTYSKQVRTIEVPIFKNTTSEPGLELMLTEAIIKQLETKGWTVRQSATADTTLSGTLTGSELRRLSLDRRTGFIQELALTLTLDFEWRDNRTDKVLVSRRSFSASDTFVPARSPTSAGEPIEAGRFSAIDRMAKDLVAELQSKW
ncbi:MAG: LptE family protein, partial [Planctomycetota bacterium]